MVLYFSEPRSLADYFSYKRWKDKKKKKNHTEEMVQHFLLGPNTLDE